MKAVDSLLIVLILLGGAYYISQTGVLNQFQQGVIIAPAPTTKQAAPAPAPKPAGGAAPPAAGTGSGDCAKTIYQSTGQTKDNTKKTKDGTRHYASGKPDDVTKEYGTSVNFKNYEFTAYFTITKIDHDDTVSFKFGGTHNGSGWYDCGVGFNSGDFCMGKEEDHPSTDLCVVKCKAIGGIVNKKIGVKCIIFNAGTGQAQLEMWGDPAANGQWQQMCPRQNGVGGFFPSSAEQETTIRIDAAPGVTMHCSAIQEVSGPTRAGGGGASPGIPPKQPVAPPTGGGKSPQSQPQSAPAPAKKANFGRVNRYKSYRVRYY